MKIYQIMLIWNREFHWVDYAKPYEDLSLAILSAKSIRDSGDGARVKNVKIIDNTSDKVVWRG